MSHLLVSGNVTSIVSNNFGSDANETIMNLTIPLRVSNPNFGGANFTTVDTEISFLTSQVGRNVDKNFQILDKRSIGVSSTWHNISTIIMFKKGTYLFQLCFHIEFSIENHLLWLKDYCQKDNSGPKIVSLNIQLATNVTFRGAGQTLI